MKVSRLEICQLVRERAMELARMIKVKLDSERVGNGEDSVFVLTGGASNMLGFAELVQKSVGIEVRHGVPDVYGTVPAELRDPVFATAVGTLMWGLTEYVPEEAGYGVRKGNSNGNGHNGNHKAESKGLFGSLKRRLGALRS